MRPIRVLSILQPQINSSSFNLLLHLLCRAALRVRNINSLENAPSWNETKKIFTNHMICKLRLVKYVKSFTLRL